MLCQLIWGHKVNIYFSNFATVAPNFLLKELIILLLDHCEVEKLALGVESSELLSVENYVVGGSGTYAAERYKGGRVG